MITAFRSFLSDTSMTYFLIGFFLALAPSGVLAVIIPLKNAFISGVSFNDD